MTASDLCSSRRKLLRVGGHPHMRRPSARWTGGNGQKRWGRHKNRPLGFCRTSKATSSIANRYHALLVASLFAIVGVVTALPSRACAQTAAPDAPAGDALERVVNIPRSSGALQRVLILTPSHPRAAIVMLPGGSGDVGIEHGGDIRHDNNFVVRSRELWAARGYAVLIPDTIDGANLRGSAAGRNMGNWPPI